MIGTVLILVADDNAEIRSALSLVIREVVDQKRAPVMGAGTPTPCCTVLEAAHMADAVRVLRDNQLDAMIVDWDLPGLDVAQLMEELRGGSPRCKVIALGAPSASDRGGRLGAIHFVSKNDPPERLLGLLGTL